MCIVKSLFPGLLLLAGTTLTMGQTAPPPPMAPAVAPPSAIAAELPSQKVLLKIGLNAGRALRYGGYYGVASQLPVTVGAEYLLNSKFTLYGQVDTDFNFFERDSYSGYRNPLVPTGAVGLGLRYYGNHPRGPFEGPYLGAEVHTEIGYVFRNSTRLNPALNVVAGMQRRLGKSFLYDLNAGVGVGRNRYASSYYYNASPLTITTQLNLGIYFGH